MTMPDLIPLDEILAEAAGLFDEAEDAKAFDFLREELGETLRDKEGRLWLWKDKRFKEFLRRYDQRIIDECLRRIKA